MDGFASDRSTPVAPGGGAEAVLGAPPSGRASP